VLLYQTTSVALDMVYTYRIIALLGITNKFIPILKVVKKIASNYTIYSMTNGYPRCIHEEHVTFVTS